MQRRSKLLMEMNALKVEIGQSQIVPGSLEWDRGQVSEQRWSSSANKRAGEWHPRPMRSGPGQVSSGKHLTNLGNCDLGQVSCLDTHTVLWLVVSVHVIWILASYWPRQSWQPEWARVMGNFIGGSFHQLEDHQHHHHLSITCHWCYTGIGSQSF